MHDPWVSCNTYVPLRTLHTDIDATGFGPAQTLSLGDIPRDFLKTPISMDFSRCLEILSREI